MVKLQGGWDDPIDERHLDCWVENLYIIQELRDFKIPRCVLSPGDIAENWELIVTTDASQVISAAAAYISVKVGEERKCLLVAAKSKLVSKMTIPRAELRACVIGACLGEIVSRTYGPLITKRTFVTDSTVALSWIHTDDRPLQVGVRNAVIQICRFTSPNDWSHIPSEANPADLATRGSVPVSEIGPGSVWQTGHSWMRAEDDQRPTKKFEEVTLTNDEKVAVSSEVRASDVNGIVLTNDISKITDRYHYTKYFLDPCAYPWPTYIRRLAVLMRICRIWRKKDQKFTIVQGKACVVLSEDDIRAAEHLTFRLTSKEVAHFNKKEALRDCVWDGEILKYSGRFLDLSELNVQTGAFLDITTLSFNVPAVDRFSPVAYSVMVYAHTKLTHHGGAVSSLREAMKIIHILHGKDLAVEVRRDCAFCKRFKAKTLETEMGKVHPKQTCVAPAF